MEENRARVFVAPSPGQGRLRPLGSPYILSLPPCSLSGGGRGGVSVAHTALERGYKQTQVFIETFGVTARSFSCPLTPDGH